MPGYTASKSAVAGLVRAFANEWGMQGVCVNGIYPVISPPTTHRHCVKIPERSAAILGPYPQAAGDNRKILKAPLPRFTRIRLRERCYTVCGWRMDGEIRWLCLNKTKQTTMEIRFPQQSGRSKQDERTGAAQQFPGAKHNGGATRSILYTHYDRVIIGGTRTCK